EFYERAGIVKTLGSKGLLGSITAIGAVSPPGGDLSEPVSQGTLRIVKVFWGLSATLAYKRHFPAIDWMQSYSLYAERLSQWYTDNLGNEWNSLRNVCMSILQEESTLDEIVRLVGMDALGNKDRLTMEVAKTIREDYLHQNAFHETDTYASLAKQLRMLKLIVNFYNLGQDALLKNVDIQDIIEIPVREQIGRSKYIEEENLSKFDSIEKKLKKEIADLIG
ncbi:MAG: V-type ATP synthase subunit A, partial [Clostridia bacterium]